MLTRRIVPIKAVAPGSVYGRSLIGPGLAVSDSRIRSVLHQVEEALGQSDLVPAFEALLRRDVPRS
jgi:hypothetical protein